MHLEPQRFAETTYLAVLAFRDGDLELRESVADRVGVQCERLHDTVLELYAASSRRHRRSDIAANGRDVRPFHFRARVREHVRRVPIRREHEDAFGQVVEAPDVGQTGYVRHEIEHGTTPGRIRARGDHAGRLVEYNPLEFRGSRRDLVSIDRNPVHGGIDGLSCSSDFAIHTYTPGRDELLGLAPRRDTRASKRAVDSHRLRCHAPGVVADAGAAVRIAMASSSALGSSSRCRSANCSRKIGVVP